MEMKAKASLKFLRMFRSFVDTFVLIIILLLLVFGSYAMWDSNQIHTAASSAQYEICKPTAESASFNVPKDPFVEEQTDEETVLATFITKELKKLAVKGGVLFTIILTVLIILLIISGIMIHRVRRKQKANKAKRNRKGGRDYDY